MPESIELTVPQAYFIRSKARLSAFFGGWGNGKTFSGCLKGYMFMQKHAGSTGLIGRKNFTDLNKSTRESFYELVPPADIKQRNDSDNFCILQNDAKVHFVHTENTRGLYGLNINWFYLDQAEEMEERALLDVMSRQRKAKGERLGWVTGNPAANWTKDWFKDDEKFEEKIYRFKDPMGVMQEMWQRWKTDIVDVGGKRIKLDTYVVDAATTTNPHLPPDYVASLMKQYPEPWVRRYVLGSWDFYEGQVYPGLKDPLHVIDPFTIPEGWERGRGMDYGASSPTACVYGAVDWDGNIFIYDEYCEPRRPISEHVKAIKEKAGAYDRVPTFLDPSCWHNTLQDKGRIWSVADEFSEHGLVCVRANNEVLAGINRVSEHLILDPEHIHPLSHALGSPRLFIFRNCTKLIRYLKSYVWREDITEATTYVKEHPIKKDDHLPDALRYYLMSRPAISRPKKALEYGSLEYWQKRAHGRKGNKKRLGNIGFEPGL